MRTKLKIFQWPVAAVAGLGVMILVQGCALLVVGGVAAGAAYGTVEYVENTLDVTEAVPLEKAWSAANATLKELKMPVTTFKKDGASGKIQAHNAAGQPVTIQVSWQTSGVTEIKISVGTFDSAVNRSQALQIYDHMKAHF
jgi:hypothetical protein